MGEKFTEHKVGEVTVRRYDKGDIELIHPEEPNKVFGYISPVTRQDKKGKYHGVDVRVVPSKRVLPSTNYLNITNARDKEKKAAKIAEELALEYELAAKMPKVIKRTKKGVVLKREKK